MSPNEAISTDVGVTRVVANIPGQYSLADLRDARGERRIFACRAVSFSRGAIVFAAPVKGKIGERVIAQIDGIGKLQGMIARVLEHGFVMNIVAPQEERDRLVAKFVWLENQKNCDVLDKRVDKRSIPKNPHSKIIFADGRVESCFVLDLSISGAAVAADTMPDIGAILAVGSIVGRVVRQFAEGFAVQFVQRQRRENVEAMLILSDSM